MSAPINDNARPEFRAAGAGESVGANRQKEQSSSAAAVQAPIRGVQSTCRAARYSAPDGQLPRFVSDMLAAPPKSGEGVHGYLFQIARQLHAHRDEEEIAAMLRVAVAGCGRVVSDREIEDAIRNSKACAWTPTGQGGTQSAVSAWPPLDPKRRAAIIAEGVTLGGLFDASPEYPAYLGAETLIDALFPGNPWLCVGWDSRTFKTRQREELRGELAELALIVPSPMTGRTGTTQDGRESEHTLANTGPRRYLVIEFDAGTVDEQAALLAHLAGYAPLGVAVHSGSKSLHGWFACRGMDDEAMKPFMRYAVSLGADKATWTRSQFVRMPGGLREKTAKNGAGQRQRVFYFNPALIGGAK